MNECDDPERKARDERFDQLIREVPAAIKSFDGRLSKVEAVVDSVEYRVNDLADKLARDTGEMKLALQANQSAIDAHSKLGDVERKHRDESDRLLRDEVRALVVSNGGMKSDIASLRGTLGFAGQGFITIVVLGAGVGLLCTGHQTEGAWCVGAALGNSVIGKVFQTRNEPGKKEGLAS